MNKNYKRIIAVILSFIMILSLGMSVVTVRAENTTRSSQTIDGTEQVMIMLHAHQMFR